ERLAHDLERRRARHPPAADERDLQPAALHLRRDLRAGAVDDADLVALRVECENVSGRVLGDCPAALEDDSAQSDQKGTPSRWRFHPPSPLAFRLGLAAFPVQPSETTSTYSRSVLGARGNLWEGVKVRKGVWTRKCAKSENFFRRVPSGRRGGGQHSG